MFNKCVGSADVVCSKTFLGTQLQPYGETKMTLTRNETAVLGSTQCLSGYAKLNRVDPPDYVFLEVPEGIELKACQGCDIKERLKEYGLGKWLPGGVMDVSCTPIPCNRGSNRGKRLKFTETPEQYHARLSP